MAAKKIISLIFLFLFSLSSIAIIVSAEKGPVEDAYWKQREADAERKARQSVNPHPEKVTEEWNNNVGQYEIAYEKQHRQK